MFLYAGVLVGFLEEGLLGVGFLTRFWDGLGLGVR